MKKTIAAISLLTLSSTAAAGFSADELAKASCDFNDTSSADYNPRWAGSVYGPSIEHKGNKVYFTLEGCGGGNTVEYLVAIVKNGKIVKIKGSRSHVPTRGIGR